MYRASVELGDQRTPKWADYTTIRQLATKDQAAKFGSDHWGFFRGCPANRRVVSGKLFTTCSHVSGRHASIST